MEVNPPEAAGPEPGTCDLPEEEEDRPPRADPTFRVELEEAVSVDVVPGYQVLLELRRGLSVGDSSSSSSF